MIYFFVSPTDLIWVHGKLQKIKNMFDIDFWKHF